MMIHKTTKMRGAPFVFASLACVMAAGHGLLTTPDASDYVRAVLLLAVPFLMKYLGGTARPLGITWQDFEARRRKLDEPQASAARPRA